MEGERMNPETDANSGANVQYLSSEEKVRDPETERRQSKSGKRRSGFARGRISLTQLSKDAAGAATESELAGGELCRQIPTDMPDQQRLSLFSRLALRHTLEVLDREFEDVPEFESFKAEALESVGATIDKMESDGTFEKACSAPSLAPNPANTQMDVTISEMKESIDRLQREDREWEKLVQKLEAQTEQAQQQLSELEMPYENIPDDVKELSSSFLPPPTEIPDLASIGQEAIKNVKTISLLMEEYCHNIELLNTASSAARKHMDHLTQNLDHEGCCRGLDPKEQIRELLSG